MDVPVSLDVFLRTFIGIKKRGASGRITKKAPFEERLGLNDCVKADSINNPVFHASARIPPIERLAARLLPEAAQTDLFAYVFDVSPHQTGSDPLNWRPKKRNIHGDGTVALAALEGLLTCPPRPTALAR